ncbi:hypothetical protein Q4E93_03295 [Flavitalea sp. BT771]|uniref:alpha-L-rhamnosidase-related protein n=1 Tax=Flavitalea sp. BT771 TaxID=3063329 RepID=UPI0026E29FAA|nr:hypothetical protein [Flavitalea sp. BT771]MDO6429600.1 hypothetical protein [Flavitalea sp. BT771]MDV6218272.1 hypothetical protein [Flavitalea sp. BT771]
MATRRNFIKKSFLSGLLIYKGAGFWETSPDDPFTYSSKYLRLTLDRAYPQLLEFDVDSLGGSQFYGSPLLPVPDKSGANAFTNKVGRNRISWFLKGFQNKPAWEMKCDEKTITIRTQYTEGAPAMDPFVIAIAQKLNHATVLGLLTPEKKIGFPCLFHLPGRGTFRMHCDRSEVTLGYDAYRFKAKGDKGTPFVKAEFQAADAKTPSITYTLEAVAVFPDLKDIRGDARLDGLRRNFINIFQLNPREKVLANNSASDPCAFTLFLYAEMARRTPKLTSDFSALDLIRSSLDVYLGGYKGYGQVGYYYNNQYGWLSKFDSTDSAPSLIISACYYILDTKDKTWARKNYAGIKSWAAKMIQTDTNGDGIIEYGHSGNTGSWDQKPFQRPANWWDAIGFGHDDAYSNALAYRAAGLLAEVAALLGETSDQNELTAFAEKLKAGYFNHFYNADTGVLAGWRSADGQLHDYYFTFVNGVAVCYGLLTPEQGRQVMQRIVQKMKEVGFSNFKMGLPGNLIPVPPADYVAHEKHWGHGDKPDGSDAFQIYENGGATGCYAYFTIKALYELGLRKEADDIFLPMMEAYKENGFDGHCDGSNYTKDWKTWDGQCWGYEGFLVDSYLPMLAVYDWQR